MRTDIPDILRDAMKHGTGKPIVRLHYQQLQGSSYIGTEDGFLIGTEDGSALIDSYVLALVSQNVIKYVMSRLKCSVTAELIPEQKPAKYAAMFYIERGLEIAGTEYTTPSPSFYLNTYTINLQKNEITFKGQILPDAPIYILTGGKTAKEAITLALSQNNVPVDFPTDGDIWYNWQFSNSAAFSAINSTSLLSTIRRKYMALIFPRQNGMTFGHPDTFVTDTWIDYPYTQPVKRRQTIIQSFYLKWIDEYNVNHYYGLTSLPSHDLDFIHSSVPNLTVGKLQNIYIGGDTFTQRPDFRLEHGDRITQSNKQGGTFCIELVEEFLPRTRRPWRQTIKPIAYNANVTYRPFLNGPGDRWDNDT